MKPSDFPEKMETKGFDPILTDLVRKALPSLKAYAMCGLSLDFDLYPALEKAYDEGDNEAYSAVFVEQQARDERRRRHLKFIFKKKEYDQIQEN